MAYTKIIQYGDTLEVFTFEHAPYTGIHHRVVRKRKSAVRAVFRSPLNVERARKAFVRLVRANLSGEEVPCFLTCTVAGLCSLDTASGWFHAFMERLRRKCQSKLRYIVVPEFQERGAPHFHALVWGLPDEWILREGSAGGSRGKAGSDSGQRRFAAWLEAKGYGVEEVGNERRLQALWGRGFLDIVPTDNSPRLASYMGKYMSKALPDERLLGKKAYRASGNILRPVQSAGETVGAFVPEIVGVDNSPLQEKSFNTKWLGRAIYQRYSLSKE